MTHIDETSIDTMNRFGIFVPQEFILKHVFGFTSKEIKKFEELQTKDRMNTLKQYPENVIPVDFSNGNGDLAE